jgi:molybdopterin-guanine dinucleotide biosynthesis protein A
MSRAGFTAALVAGGKSSRMGSDKRFIQIDGEPLWRRQLATLEALGPTELLISADPGAHWPRGTRVVPDREPGQGPLGALRALLSAASYDRVLVLAVDLPMMTPAFLGSLLDVPGSLGAVPRHEDVFEPLAAVYPRACLPVADELLQRRELSLQGFVRTTIRGGLTRTIDIGPEQAALFVNLNTPAQVKALRLSQCAAVALAPRDLSPALGV